MKSVITLPLVVLIILSGTNLAGDETQISDEISLQTFSSYDALKDFLTAAREIASFGLDCFPPPRQELWPSVVWGWSSGLSPPVGSSILEGASKTGEISFNIGADELTPLDYSKTNIQVAGVDEPDIVKTDGEYIYLVSKNRIFIIKAWPPEEIRVVSRIRIEGTVVEIFKNKNTLVIFGNDIQPTIALLPYHPRPTAFVSIYDISDRKNPILKDEIMMPGRYFNARMIGDFVYVIINTPIDCRDDVFLPQVVSKTRTDEIEPSEIYHFDVFDYSYHLTTVLSINLVSGQWAKKVFLVGGNQDLYVSTNNIYLVYRKGMSTANYWRTLIQNLTENLPAEVRTRVAETQNLKLSEHVRKTKEILCEYYGRLEDNEKWLFRNKVRQSIQNAQAKRNQEITVIYKLSIVNGKIVFRAKGEVPGRVLNQFSMDEYEGYFRIATTTGRLWSARGDKAKNHVYVLDQDLKIIGRLENLAEGERIYSVRFMGDRAYLVTFKKVDPLFVIGLEDPTNPKVLGELKIPGYSNYLHPYDETHLIGIGKDTIESAWGNFAWYQGVKLALFDVSDPKNPKEISKYVIGRRGTESPVLRDHRAFLFSRSKNLLVLPVSVVENNSGWWCWDYDWMGAYVFEISPTRGIVLKHKIEHPDSVKRSLYIENVLYTISEEMVKLISLTQMEEIATLQLP